MSRRNAQTLDARPWTGPTRHYDILKEGAIALGVVTVLVLALAAVFSSPDKPAVTFKDWAHSDGSTFYATMVSELSGSSETAGYGPPYNNGSDGLSVGPLALQKWAGVAHPIDAAQDFVITPLESQQQSDAVKAALDAWNGASADQQTTWAGDYETALNDEAGAAGDPAKVPAGEYGPVPVLAQAATDMANSGAYDGVLMAQGQFFQTDYTKQLLLMGDGGYMEDIAVSYHLAGNAWGMVNEAGSFPGQLWLAPFSVWYQPPVFNNEDPDNKVASVLTDNADAIIFFLVLAIMLIFLLLPFIPGLRSIPRWIPVHRLVWRQWYAEHGRRT